MIGHDLLDAFLFREADEGPDLLPRQVAAAQDHVRLGDELQDVVDLGKASIAHDDRIGRLESQFAKLKAG
ncbi:MAG: hypothetical protein QF593_12335, partial [Nitrospinota bacterium]|nr:hypothetical protein [Nitrospinota bacterium]